MKKIEEKINTISIEREMYDVLWEQKIFAPALCGRVPVLRAADLSSLIQLKCFGSGNKSPELEKLIEQKLPIVRRRVNGDWRLFLRYLDRWAKQLNISRQMAFDLWFEDVIQNSGEVNTLAKALNILGVASLKVKWDLPRINWRFRP